MKKGTVFLLSALSLLAGIVIGFLCAPIKGGIYCGNNYNNQRYFDNEEETEDFYGC